MSNFDSTVARMKALYTYGNVNEGKNHTSLSTLEYSKEAADGKIYGIVRESNHYYIKQTVKGKEKLAESYDYIGGFLNKRNYEYDSYQKALKNFELKLASINEASEKKVNIATLDPFKKEDLCVESTQKMQDEIARQRQIMFNTAMILGESTIGFKNTGTPEAPKGNNDADKPFTETAKAELDKDFNKTTDNPSENGEPFGAKDKPEAGKDVKDSDVASDGKSVAVQKPTGGKVVKVNESCEDGKCDWGSEGIGKGEDPKSIGWDVEGQQKVNEDDEKEWGSEGLPASAGVGSPDGHIMESEEDDLESDDDLDVEEDEFTEDDLDLDDEEGLGDEDDLDLDDEEEEEELDDEETLDVTDDEEGLGDEEEFSEEENAVDESDPESIKAEIERLQSLLDGMEDEGEEELPADGEEEGTEVPELEDGVPEASFPEDGDEVLHDEEEFNFNESKRKYLNSIVESVVKDFLKEDELHDFGKHPGYRKKPMTLPETGSDKNEHGEDWNDESVHNEEPFGSKIGDGDPFDKIVDAVTKDVMYQMRHGGSPIENKKKVN